MCLWIARAAATLAKPTASSKSYAIALCSATDTRSCAAMLSSFAQLQELGAGRCRSSHRRRGRAPGRVARLAEENGRGDSHQGRKNPSKSENSEGFICLIARFVTISHRLKLEKAADKAEDGDDDDQDRADYGGSFHRLKPCLVADRATRRAQDEYPAKEANKDEQIGQTLQHKPRSGGARGIHRCEQDDDAQRRADNPRHNHPFDELVEACSVGGQEGHGRASWSLGSLRVTAWGLFLAFPTT